MALLLAHERTLEVLRARFRGTEAEAAAARVLEEVHALLPAQPPARGIEDAGALIRRLESHLTRDEIGLAALCLQLALSAEPSAEERRKLEHLGSVLRERRAQRAQREVR